MLPRVPGNLPAAFLLLVCVLLASCGVGDGQIAGGGIGGTGITTGTLTGFGSIFVNGIEFDTAGASRNIDDVATVSNGFDDISVMGAGMVVTVTGTINPDGITGTATSITYDAVVSGPIGVPPSEDPDGVRKTFGVLDQTVLVDRDQTVFVNTDYASLQMHDVVELSGFFDSAGTLMVTRLEWQGRLGQGTVVETRGVVSGFDGIDTFSIGALNVTFSGATVFEDLPGTVTNGQHVEVNGVLQGANSILATRIQRESETVEYYTGEIRIEGLVTSFTDIGNFRLDGLPVDASAAAFSPLSLAASLANDQRIEVQGTIAGGMVVADLVEQRGGEVRLAGRLVSRDAAAGTLNVEVVAGQPPVPVRVDARTQLEDEQQQVVPFTLLQLVAGDPVKVQGFLDNSGGVIAGEIKRRALEAFGLTGPVEAASGDASSGSVTVLGVAMATDGSTEFENSNDQHFPGGGSGFYSAVMPGDYVELEDELPSDGIADEVELRE